ncbi:MAG: hypothetical protein MZV70_24125 [Desulfobacterales bacterium]|nr:hypothetical protein [Desulfobacterales bacterium]
MAFILLAPESLIPVRGPFMKIKSASGERGIRGKIGAVPKELSRQTASADESAVGLLGQLKIIHYPRR